MHERSKVFSERNVYVEKKFLFRSPPIFQQKEEEEKKFREEMILNLFCIQILIERHFFNKKKLIDFYFLHSKKYQITIY